ncbi:MAG: TAXI family TRAP transporter solute-binding subunit [Clostridia bacterium]|nr:TAXI family TRAP transporter solute-binding subunit [Clostridia bacterium]
MKKLLTMILTLTLSFTMVFSLTACGGAEKGVYLLSLSDSVMNEFIADNKIDGKYDVYGKQEITNDQYDFISATDSVKTIGVSATYIVDNSLSEEQVYKITKALWESKGSIGHSVESTMDINKALITIGNVPIHAGAAKYYKEQGIEIADDRIAPAGTDIISNVNIRTGGTGGTYYAFTNGLQTPLAQKSGYNFTVLTSGGSVESLKKIGDDCKMAIVQNDTMVNAYNGLTSNFADGAKTNFSVIGEVYPEVMQIVTNDSSIKTLADLKGSNKVVSIGAIGSGVEANAVALLKKYGIDMKQDANGKYTSSDITIENLSVADSADGMKDEVIDVFFFTSGAPATSITELALALK